MILPLALSALPLGLLAVSGSSSPDTASPGLENVARDPQASTVPAGLVQVESGPGWGSAWETVEAVGSGILSTVSDVAGAVTSIGRAGAAWAWVVSGVIVVAVLLGGAWYLGLLG
jgi:hypothetical protein